MAKKKVFLKKEDDLEAFLSSSSTKKGVGAE